MNKIANFTNNVRVTYSTSAAFTPTVVALGKFDGLHCGHQQVIQPILNHIRTQESGKKNRSLTKEHIYPTVVTFNPHPQEFFTGKPWPLLTPLQEKVQELQNCGVEQLVLLPFDKELTTLSPQDFVEKILVQQLKAQMISVGEDFRFGKHRSGTTSDLQDIAAKFNIPVVIVPNYSFQGERISSSSIRQALAKGDMHRVKVLLNYPYNFTGKVVKVQQLDRSIGFSPAKIQLTANKLLPRHGVYAVRVFIVNETVDASSLSNQLLPIGIGVMNVAHHLIVNDTYPSVEVHLLDWLGDLYDKTLIVQLEEFLRPEQKFSSSETLKAQITADCAKARYLLLRSTNLEKFAG
ncbi:MULTISPECIES: bifunctional riboflavin kinase/FAD synthetase [unclassified Nostoc]|uniref:bifunctional riboflavin kinase/FAD synthetase n=1 Tax=unclassified Nostoc TaxID=2593658 RepID=UPI002AD2E57D|nr:MULTISPECIES: bifunctional riboflavin kinase/FAD synthetase [unclassified Nostoc]MDZ8120604.1 bifunctional riboflavin kinase/FAD synthetase [Nostoc sp. CmiVER01]MDZ8225150.1 bifunctional riboflavin kinase/FAD synthetase [Nostoc sp. ChiVER01]